MDYKELIENLKAWDEEYISSACGEASLHCEHFCIPGKDCLVTQAVTAITDLLARAEEAEQKVNELERALSDASKIVNTMQESTIPFYRRRAEEAEADNARLRELVEADLDGRCVVLPCKEGAILPRYGREYTADHWNVLLTAFADDETSPTGKRLELFSVEDASEAVLKGEQNA